MTTVLAWIGGIGVAVAVFLGVIAAILLYVLSPAQNGGHNPFQ